MSILGSVTGDVPVHPALHAARDGLLHHGEYLQRLLAGWSQTSAHGTGAAGAWHCRLESEKHIVLESPLVHDL